MTTQTPSFIILPEAQGSVTAGTLVEVQVMEGAV